MNQNLMSINEAVSKGVSRLRIPKWAIPEDQLHLYIVEQKDGKRVVGPWAKLYSPFNFESKWIRL